MLMIQTPGYQVEQIFEAKWGVAPGEFYDAYKLVKSFRDGLQKAIWINKGNPELRDRLIEAMTAMANDPINGGYRSKER